MKPQASQKSKKSALIAVCGLFAACLLILFLLPTILSSNWVSNFAKQAINDKSPGIIDFESASFSWLKGLYLQNIVYEDQTEGITFTAKKISTEKGLLSLAADYTNIGTVTITEPTTYIHSRNNNTTTAAAKGTTPEVSAVEQPGSLSQNESASPVQPSTTKPVDNAIPQVDGTLVISGGSFFVVTENNTKKAVLTSLEVIANLASKTNTLEYEINFLNGDGSGKVDGSGTISLPDAGSAALDHLEAKANLKIDTWEIEDLLSILSRIKTTPMGSGIVTGQIDIEGSFASSLQIKGNITGSEILLSGGGLQSDTPSLNNVALEIDLTKTPSALEVHRLNVTSPLITGEVSGGISGVDGAEITGIANLDVAEIFKQFPATLNLQEGISVSEGNVNIDARLKRSEDAALFDARAQLKRMEGTAANTKISWDQPVTVVLKGEQGKDGLKLERFEAISSFLNAHGHGSSELMQFNLKGDLGAALKEFKKFIKLDDWNSSGAMDMSLQVTKQSATTYPIEGTMNVTDFVLQYKNRLIAPKDLVILNIKNIAHVDPNKRPLHITGTALDFQSWLGKGTVSVSKAGLPTEKRGLSLENLALRGSFDLKSLSDSLQALEILPQDFTIGGESAITTDLSLKEEKLKIESLTVDTIDFVYQTEKKSLREKKIQFMAHGSADLSKKSAMIESVEIQTAAARIDLPNLVITNWNTLDSGVRANATADIEIGELLTLLDDYIDIPEGVSIAGKAGLELAVDLTKAEEQSVQILANIKPLAIGSKTKLFSEDSIAFSVDLTGNSVTQNYKLNKLNLTTSPLSLESSGGLVSEGTTKRLDTEGFINLDLEALSKHLQSLLDIELTMKGVSKSPYIVKAQSTDGRWDTLKSLSEFSTSFSAESIVGHGLHVEALEMPVNFKDGHGTININGKVNQGELSMLPLLDLAASPATLSFSDNSTILTGVELTADMSEDIMSKIHPLFKGAAVTSGSLDLTMQNFNWPIDKALQKEAAFTGYFTFHDVKLRASGILTPLLALMKIDEEEITLSDEPMTFRGANERITCSPLTIMTKNYSLILSGSIGFDQSLEYVAKIPVTRKLVGSDAFKYLEGTFITVPVRGSVSDPQVSNNVVQDALADLMKQAGKKELTNQAGKLLQKLFQ